jgi:hypothetical protein
MHLRSYITAIVLFFMATCTVNSVCAWQHPFHERVARISQSTLPGYYMIDWNGVFLGTKEPDFRREDCPWINQSHKKDHWRIKASSDAAVQTLRNHTDPALAGRRLGRAFHYLQDQTEASQKTKDRFSQVFSRPQAKSFADFRSVADLVLASIEKQSGGIASGPLSFSKYWRDRTQEYGKCIDWPKIYNAVDNLKSGFDLKMNNAMNAAPDIGPAIEVFHWYFASLVALQNQIVRLYAADLRDTKTYLDQFGQMPLGKPYIPKPEGPTCGDKAAPYRAECERIYKLCIDRNCKVSFSDCRNQCGSCAGHVVGQTFSDYWCQMHSSYLPTAQGALDAYIAETRRCVDLFLAGQLKVPYMRDQQIGYCMAPHAKLYEERWKIAVAEACRARCARDNRKGVVKFVPHRCECE